MKNNVFYAANKYHIPPKAFEIKRDTISIILSQKNIKIVLILMMLLLPSSFKKNAKTRSQKMLIIKSIKKNFIKKKQLSSYLLVIARVGSKSIARNDTIGSVEKQSNLSFIRVDFNKVLIYVQRYHVSLSLSMFRFFSQKLIFLIILVVLDGFLGRYNGQDTTNFYVKQQLVSFCIIAFCMCNKDKLFIYNEKNYKLLHNIFKFNQIRESMLINTTVFTEKQLINVLNGKKCKKGLEQELFSIFVKILNKNAYENNIKERFHTRMWLMDQELNSNLRNFCEIFYLLDLNIYDKLRKQLIFLNIKIKEK